MFKMVCADVDIKPANAKNIVLAVSFRRRFTQLIIFYLTSSGYWVLYTLGKKRPGLKANYSPPIWCLVRISGSITLLNHTPFWRAHLQIYLSVVDSFHCYSVCSASGH
jgi:hypothetical protein